ncbi:MAG: YraN family protein [Bacteroidota bacterium]|nr:YraN family protein [Bacteroidota bacterium]
MSESHSLGRKGEALAAEHLQKKGYKIRHRNWVSGRNEVDIVAENKDYVVFVEVKTRSEELLDVRELVPPKKQKILEYVAHSYIRRYGLDKESRFDVIVITGDEDNLKINHIEDAFYPTLR